MKLLGQTLALVFIYLAPASEVVANTNSESTPLVFEQHWVLAGANNLQPSGLSVCGSELVMVSDRHSQTVFSIPLPTKSTTQIKTYRPISPFNQLPDDIKWQQQVIDWGLRWTQKRFDWEGIHCNSDGSIYLASESLSAVAIVEPNGHSRWVTPSFSVELQKRGFISTLNTGFEGITSNHEHLLIAIEREPRGLLRASLTTRPAAIDDAQIIDNEGVISPLSPDFTGLWLEHNEGYSSKIYTLERNYFRVCRRTYDDWVIETCWSYRNTEKAKSFRFKNDHYGLAEGLARIGEHIYIVLDNNDEPRLTTGNRNPLLFRFKKPSNW